MAGAFDTTLGSVRQLSAGADPPLFADLDDQVAATLCYVDADIAKGPPPGPNGEIREPFDRVVLALVGARIEVALAGYRGDVPVLAPPS